MKFHKAFAPVLLLLTLCFLTACSQNAIYIRSVADLNAKAKALLEQGDLDGAISRLESARDLAPGEPSTLFNLGIAYSQKGKLDQAIQDFEALLNSGKMDRVKVLEPLSVIYEQKADELVSAAAEAQEAAPGKTARAKSSKTGISAETPTGSVATLKSESIACYEKAIQTLQQIRAGMSKQATREETSGLDTHIAQLQKRVEEVSQGELKPLLGQKSSNKVHDPSPE